MEKQLFYRADFLQSLFDSIPSLLFIVDSDVRVYHLNAAASNLLGVKDKESIFMKRGGELMHCINSFETPEGCGRSIKCRACVIRNSVNRAFNGENVYREITKFHSANNGSNLDVDLMVTVSPLVFEDEKCVLLILEDITKLKTIEEELRKANERLAQQARTDALTGAYNRLWFDEVIPIEISKARRYAVPLSIIMFDIDYFKQVNDTYGHHTGDTVLKETVDLMRKSLRNHDYLVRWGGEEFLILLPHTEFKKAMRLAERLRHAVEAHDFTNIPGITCSFGLTGLRSDDDVNSFTKRVDDILYKAKQQGRNRVEAFL